MQPGSGFCSFPLPVMIVPPCRGDDVMMERASLLSVKNWTNRIKRIMHLGGCHGINSCLSDAFYRILCPTGPIQEFFLYKFKETPAYIVCDKVPVFRYIFIFCCQKVSLMILWHTNFILNIMFVNQDRGYSTFLKNWFVFQKQTF